MAEVNANSAKAEFKLQYKLSEPDTYKTYQYYFDVSDFKVGFCGFVGIFFKVLSTDFVRAGCHRGTGKRKRVLSRGCGLPFTLNHFKPRSAH